MIYLLTYNRQTRPFRTMAAIGYASSSRPPQRSPCIQPSSRSGHRIGKRLVVQSTVSRAKQLARCTRQSLLQRVSNKDLPHLSFLYDPQDIIYGIICFSCKLSLHKYIFERDPQLIIALAGLGDFVRREVRNHIHTQRILCVWLCMYVYLHTGNHILTHIVT